MSNKIIFKLSENTTELQQIIALQAQNLAVNISEEEKKKQGFVTVVHTLADLQKTAKFEANIIAVDGANLAAYVLAMTRHSANDMPVLKPMFTLFESIDFKGKKLSKFNYLVVGQTCVAKPYRGTGIFDESYRAFKNHFSAKYELCLTEISVHNKRSLAAHQRIGFQVVHQYSDTFGNDWCIVAWTWS